MEIIYRGITAELIRQGVNIPNQPEITDPNTIYMGSKSQIKIVPLQDWHDKNFGAGVYTVEGIDAPSGVPNQPIGLHQTIEGTLNRLKYIMDARPGAFGYVAIENGLILDQETGLWYDRAIMNGAVGGKQFFTISSGVYVPHYYVELIEKSKGAITWGDLEYAAQLRLGDQDQELDPQDPQNTMTDGTFPRRRQFEELIDIFSIGLRPIVYHPSLEIRHSSN